MWGRWEKPVGLGEGDSLKAGDDKSTLSKSFLILLPLIVKSGELLCDSKVEGDLHEFRGGLGAGLSDELSLCFE